MLQAENKERSRAAHGEESCTQDWSSAVCGLLLCVSFFSATLFPFEPFSFREHGKRRMMRAFLFR